MPTVDIPDKICYHCGGTKWYYSPKDQKYKCKKIRDDQWNNWRISNSDYFRKKRREYYHTKVDKAEHYKKTRERALKHPDREAQYKIKYATSQRGKDVVKQYRTLNAEKVTQWKRNQKSRGIKTLSDHYIKELVIRYNDLSFADVPPELIELKRKQLLLKRQIKNNGKIQKTISSGS